MSTKFSEQFPEFYKKKLKNLETFEKSLRKTLTHFRKF